jgi:diguanylate cyclase (GGDEF)-like protein
MNRTSLGATEIEVLRWVQEGRSEEEIGRIMGDSEAAVRKEIKGIMRKLGAESPQGAIEKAIEKKILPPVELGEPGMRGRRLKVCIVGCGKGGAALLDILKDDLSVKVVGVAEINPLAKGLRVAKAMKIPVYSDYREIIGRGIDIIINVTGLDAVAAELKAAKPHHVEVIDGLSARLLWQLIEERTKRSQERERALKEHETLYHLGLLIENIDSMKDAAHAIVDYASRLTGTPAGSLAVFDDRREDMVLMASKGFSAGFRKVERWPVRKGGLTDHVLNQNRPFVVHDIKDLPSANPLLKKEGIKSLMAAPLTIDGRIVGILYVNDFNKRVFRAEDVSLFSLLTVYAALTIERVKSIEDIRLLSITDGLTGLYNHRYLMENLGKDIQRAARHKHQLSLIMLDIDHFKQYNDKYGHLEGNKVLKETARILVKTARTTDTVGRFGGEEFCVVVPQIGRQGAVAFARRLLNEVAKGSGAQKIVTLSGGVSTFPKDGKSPLELIKKADARLYKAKREGRNRVCT